MNNHKIYAAILILLMIAVSCKTDVNAPAVITGSITGTIKDAVSNTPIAGVTIKIRPAISTYTTGTDGKFNFPAVNEGSYVIIASHSDYLSDSTTVNALNNKTVTVTISLRRKLQPSVITQPRLLNPANGETNTSLTVTLVWNSAKSRMGNNITYNVLLDTSPNPTTTAAAIYNDTSAVITVNRGNTCYYWKVKAFDSNLNISYSPVFSFTTKIFNPTYVTLPPVGKLPYPIHNPSFTQAQYDDMVNKVFLINNFGQDQFSYLHDGLDFVARNGTKIFAIDSGYVKSIELSSNPSYNTMVIADKDNPNAGWSYTHIGNFKVNVGDFVEQGTYIAEISFAGVEHIHLNRIYCLPGADLSSFNDQIMVQPDKYFYLPDTKAPLIKTPLYYFQNNSDNQFTGSGIINVNGEVDIVVGMRETGEYARGRDPNYYNNFGDRIAINEIIYTITGPDNITHSFSSFDFSKIHIPSKDNRATQPLIYKKYQLLEGKDRVGMGWGDYFSYYIITNNEGKENNEPLKISDAALSWNTRETLTNGTPKYPNGLYNVTVTVYDHSGLSSTNIGQVIVNN